MMLKKTQNTLNVNGLNSPIKKHRVAEWNKKQDSTICYLQEAHLSPKDKHRLKVKGWKICQANSSQKKAGVAILISDKIDLKPKKVTRDKNGQYMIIKRIIHQEDVTVIIYAPNIGAPKYIKQLSTDLKEEIDSNTIIVGDFNTSLISMNRSSRQKVHMEILALNETLNLMNLIDFYRRFHLNAAEYTFFSSAHGTFSMIDHKLRHKTSLKFKMIEIISSIFSNHKGIKLEINYKKKAGKITKMWRLDNMLQNNHWVNEEIKGEINKYLKTNESTTFQNLWDAAKVVLRGNFTVIQAYLKKQEKSQTI